MRARDAVALEACLAGGGVAVFPADTVYGLACDPEDPVAVARLHGLKGRPADKPAAVLFFSRAAALEALPELGPRTRAALARLLPGAVTVVLGNPAGRFPLACGPDPAALGLRVPALDEALAPLAAVARPLLQTSANHPGERPARRLEELPAALRAGADLVLDAGERPGIASTVVDLRAYESAGKWFVERDGAVSAEALRAALDR